MANIPKKEFDIHADAKANNNLELVFNIAANHCGILLQKTSQPAQTLACCTTAE
jgi:hypothetical protein